MFSHLYNETAVLKITDGCNEYGEAKITETINIQCRIEFKNTVVVGQNGNEITSSGRLFTDAEIKIGDIVTIEGLDYTVEQAFRSVGLDGEYGLNEVYFG